MPEPQGRVSFWGIEVFLAVAEEGAISAAARRLGVTPPAISQQLAAVEAALGSTLFDRSSRPFALTAAGQLFRRHAQVILNAEAEARSDLAQAQLSRLTTLRLGMIEDFDAEVTPALLGDLAASMGEARFLLETGPSHRLLDQLESRGLDLAVAAELGSGTADAGWRESHPILQDPFLAVRPNSAPPSGADLPLILYSTRHLMGRLIAAHLARQNFRPAVRFELDSYTAILALVAQGAGWTILTPLALHHAERFLGAVEVQPLDGQALFRSISLSARAGVMGGLPGQVAASLRRHVGERVVQPSLARWPWLADHLRLL
jgi:DNA-binding transcriptional LysR family regulator